MRTRTWIIAILLIGLAELAFAQPVRWKLWKAAPAQKQALRVSERWGEVIPIEWAQGLMLVEARVDGVTGTYILDTGSPYLILHEENLPGKNTTEMLSVVSDYKVRTKKIDEFSWVGISKRNLEAVVMDMHHLRQAYQRPIDGIIGYQLLADRKILIDAQNGYLLIVPAGEEVRHPYARPALSFSLSMQQHLPVLKMKVGAKLRYFGLDSGCSQNLIAEAVLADLPEAEYQKVRELEVYGFTAEPRLFPLVRVRSVQWSSLPSSGMEFLATDFSRFISSGLNLDGLLGYPFFKDKILSIDYSKNQLVLWSTRSEEPINPFR